MAKQRHITLAYVRSRFIYHPEEGVLRWRPRHTGSPYDAQWNGRYAGTVAGHTNKVGYVVITFEKKYKFLAHRLIWFYVHGEWPRKLLDHRDNVKSNNRLDNLREATTAQNGWNQKARRHNRSGVKGVCWDKSKRLWIAHIMARRHVKNLGRFRTKREAVQARKLAAQKYHGEFARIA
jgi:hypothetical protein